MMSTNTAPVQLVGHKEYIPRRRVSPRQHGEASALFAPRAKECHHSKILEHYIGFMSEDEEQDDWLDQILSLESKEPITPKSPRSLLLKDRDQVFQDHVNSARHDLHPVKLRQAYHRRRKTKSSNAKAA